MQWAAKNPALKCNVDFLVEFLWRLRFDMVQNHSMKNALQADY